MDSRIKHDGYRTLIVMDAGKVRAFSRLGRDWTGPYRRVVEAAAKLSCHAAVIDGEIVVQDENGISDFDALRSAIHKARHRIVFFAAFDNALVLPQGMASDAILNTPFAPFALQNYEIAAYRSLITMTELVGRHAAVPGAARSIVERRSQDGAVAWRQHPGSDATLSRRG